MFKSLKPIEILCALVVLTVLTFGVMGNQGKGEGLLYLRAEGARAIGNGYTDDRSVNYARGFFNDNPQIGTFVLRNMSGTRDADMNLRIARDIHQRGITTELEADSFIASGAVDLFLAGKTRKIACGARIGVHSWSAGKLYDAQEAAYDDRRRRQEQFLSDIGIDPDFYVFTRDAAPAKGLHIMTDEEIALFGLSTEPRNCSK